MTKISNSRTCKGCAKEKPLEEFPIKEQGSMFCRAYLCTECEEWYDKHNIIRKEKPHWQNTKVKDFIYNAF
jgi:hypothetical protein